MNGNGFAFSAVPNGHAAAPRNLYEVMSAMTARVEAQPEAIIFCIGLVPLCDCEEPHEERPLGLVCDIESAAGLIAVIEDSAREQGLSEALLAAVDQMRAGLRDVEVSEDI